jgi:hypothetical protein
LQTVNSILSAETPQQINHPFESVLTDVDNTQLDGGYWDGMFIDPFGNDSEGILPTLTGMIFEPLPGNEFRFPLNESTKQQAPAMEDINDDDVHNM